MPVIDLERFRALLAPAPRGRHAATKRPPVDPMDFVAMYWRMTRALERHVIDDPAAMLTHAVALAARVAEIPNVAVATAAGRHAQDPRSAPSINECAKAMGVTRQAAQQRRAIGDRIVAGRVAAADVERFAEAARERAARQAADDAAVVAMESYRRRAAS